MEFLNRVVDYFTKNVLKKRADENIIEISRTDAYLNYIYKILNWDDPKLSWTTFIIVNFVFMLIIQFEVKLYGFIFSSMLMILLADLYFEKMGLQEPRTIQSDSLRQVIRLIKTSLMYLHNLKRDNPSMFCGVMVSTFFTLSFIGRNISGYAFMYMIILMLFFGPYIISIIPIEYKNQIKFVLQTFINSEGVVAEAELIPEKFIDEQDNDNDLDSLHTDITQDSITNSLISGMSGMPSYLEADNNMDELEEDDLIPHQQSKSGLIYAVDYSSDSDSEHHKNMEFDSAHFNRDSSSDEEHNYVKGLKFSDVLDSSNVAISPSMVQSLGAGLLNNISAIGSNLLSNVLSSQAKPNPVRQDSDSDFEIINSEDADT